MRRQASGKLGGTDAGGGAGFEVGEPAPVGDELGFQFVAHGLHLLDLLLDDGVLLLGLLDGGEQAAALLGNVDKTLTAQGVSTGDRQSEDRLMELAAGLASEQFAQNAAQFL